MKLSEKSGKHWFRSGAVLPGVDEMMSVLMSVYVCVCGRSVSLSGGPGPLWG